jgi:hypothetical protein
VLAEETLSPFYRLVKFLEGPKASLSFPEDDEEGLLLLAYLLRFPFVAHGICSFFLAEEVGFEPTVPITEYVRLAT